MDDDSPDGDDSPDRYDPDGDDMSRDDMERDGPDRDDVDRYDLGRFVTAQDRGVYERAFGEVRAGRKTGHWMWFIFPQIAGLGLSAMSQNYAITSLDEARAYLAHPILGPRLRECAAAVAAVGAAGRSAVQIFGDIDAVKLRSSMTLFMRAATAPDELIFTKVLGVFFGGVADAATLARL